jgi:hypothetical protein
MHALVKLSRTCVIQAKRLSGSTLASNSGDGAMVKKPRPVSRWATLKKTVTGLVRRCKNTQTWRGNVPHHIEEVTLVHEVEPLHGIKEEQVPHHKKESWRYEPSREHEAVTREEFAVVRGQHGFEEL